MGITGELAEWLNRDLPATLMWDYTSIDGICEGLAHQHAAKAPTLPGVVNLQPQGARRPLFFFPGLGGHPVTFAGMASHFAPNQPCFGLTVPGLHGEEPPLSRVENIAAAMLKNLRPSNPAALINSPVTPSAVCSPTRRRSNSPALARPSRCSRFMMLSPLTAARCAALATPCVTRVPPRHHARPVAIPAAHRGTPKGNCQSQSSRIASRRRNRRPPRTPRHRQPRLHQFPGGGKLLSPPIPRRSAILPRHPVGKIQHLLQDRRGRRMGRPCAHWSARHRPRGQSSQHAQRRQFRSCSPHVATLSGGPADAMSAVVPTPLVGIFRHHLLARTAVGRAGATIRRLKHLPSSRQIFPSLLRRNVSPQ